MKKVLCLLLMAALVAHICARPDEKADAEKKAKEDKDKAEAAAKEKEKGADTAAKDITDKAGKDVEDCDDAAKAEIPKEPHKAPKKHHGPVGKAVSVFGRIIEDVGDSFFF